LYYKKIFIADSVRHFRGVIRFRARLEFAPTSGGLGLQLTF
jgi:hypothetical protein